MKEEIPEAMVEHHGKELISKRRSVHSRMNL
jgi:hypothetical protein